MRLHHVSASSPSLATFPSRPRRKKETEEGLRFAFHELLAATAALQSREKETERRVSKLEQKALSNAKVASEFQRVWTGMTTMAEKINAELKKLQARTEERESGGSACEESSLNCAELSPFSVKSTASELRGGRLSFSPKNSDNVAEDVRQREGLGNKRCEKRDSAVNTSVEHANGSVDTASICSKMMENRLKEEGRRLERVECEVHQQLLETRNCIERLDSEVDSLLIFKQHLSPNIRTKTQELQEEMDRTAEQFHSITKDLEKDLRTNIRELDLKIERLTVMFGTAAFFQRTPHPVQGKCLLGVWMVEIGLLP